MKKDQIEVGGRYTAKVSGAVVPVEITAEKWLGDKMAGWVGRNTETGRSVRIKSAQRLRAAVNGTAHAAASAEGEPAPAPAPQDATAANVGADDGAVVASAGSPKPPAKKGKGKSAKAAKTPKAPKAAAPAKEKKAKAPKEPKAKRVSALDAAAQVLAETRKPMKCIEMIEAMEAKGLWKSPGGKTPHATLYAAVIREIAAKGKDARFTKVDRGSFAARKGA